VAVLDEPDSLRRAIRAAAHNSLIEDAKKNRPKK